MKFTVKSITTFNIDSEKLYKEIEKQGKSLEDFNSNIRTVMKEVLKEEVFFEDGFIENLDINVLVQTKER